MEENMAKKFLGTSREYITENNSRKAYSLLSIRLQLEGHMMDGQKDLII